MCPRGFGPRPPPWLWEASVKTPGFLPSLPSDPVSAPEDLCQRHPALCLLPFTHHSFLSSLSAQASFSRQPALISLASLVLVSPLGAAASHLGLCGRGSAPAPVDPGPLQAVEGESHTVGRRSDGCVSPRGHGVPGRGEGPTKAACPRGGGFLSCATFWVPQMQPSSGAPTSQLRVSGDGKQAWLGS